MIFAGFGSKRLLGAAVRLRAFGRLAGLANPLGDYGQGVRLLALTGARRSEVFGMIWQEIDLSSKTWTLPVGAREE
jgi:hypothetical protein